MSNKYCFDIPKEQHDDCLTEVDFYPPSDNRILKSNVEDIAGGDNFADYCEDMFELLEEEEYYN
jgi:hypothetical protein